jgi:hypothetical protein
MKVAVVPIFRSYWLWHGLAHESKHAVVPTPSWRTGRNLEEKAQLFTEHLKAKVGPCSRALGCRSLGPTMQAAGQHSEP